MSHIYARRLSRLKRLLQLNTSIISVPKPASYSSNATLPFFCPESDPRNHTINDVGLFYAIDNSFYWDTLFKGIVIPKEFREECKTFNKTYLMIRKPAVEIIHYLNHTNYDNPVNKYVLYGKYGHGVSMVMSHLVHYAHASDWLVVNFHNIFAWLIKYTERVESTTKPGLLDLPILGSEWLSGFKNLNLNVINKLDLRLNNDYVWNIQEENKKGESLLSFLDHGIARGKYSCDVIRGLLEEVKTFSRSGKVKTLVLIDNFSVAYHPGKKCKNKKRKFLAPSQLSILESFLNMVKSDWHNGAVVLSCHAEKDIVSDSDHLPMNKLTTKGFEFLNPFVPIEVPPLTNAEMINLLDLYRSEKFILRSDSDSELKALSAGSIRTLKSLCGPI